MVSLPLSFQWNAIGRYPKGVPVSILYVTLSFTSTREIYNVLQQLKSALVANVTFYHLARNFSFCALKDLRLVQAFAAMVTSAGRSQKPSRTAIKKIADFFETIVAAYHSEAGFDKLCDWVGEFYPPLIRAAERGYHFL